MPALFLWVSGCFNLCWPGISGPGCVVGWLEGRPVGRNSEAHGVGCLHLLLARSAGRYGVLSVPVINMAGTGARRRARRGRTRPTLLPCPRSPSRRFPPSAPGRGFGSGPPPRVRGRSAAPALGSPCVSPPRRRSALGASTVGSVAPPTCQSFRSRSPRRRRPPTAAPLRSMG